MFKVRPKGFGFPHLFYYQENMRRNIFFVLVALAAITTFKTNATTYLYSKPKPCKEGNQSLSTPCPPENFVIETYPASSFVMAMVPLLSVKPVKSADPVNISEVVNVTGPIKMMMPVNAMVDSLKNFDSINSNLSVASESVTESTTPNPTTQTATTLFRTTMDSNLISELPTVTESSLTTELGISIELNSSTEPNISSESSTVMVPSTSSNQISSTMSDIDTVSSTTDETNFLTEASIFPKSNSESSTMAESSTESDFTTTTEPENDCENCTYSCSKSYKNGTLILFTSPCGMNYSDSLMYCEDQGGEMFIPRQKGDNDVMFQFGADFYSDDSAYEFFWYPMERPDYEEDPVWANGAKYDAYETPFYKDSNNNIYKCFQFKKDGNDVSTYDQFCKATNSRPVCEMINNLTSYSTTETTMPVNQSSVPFYASTAPSYPAITARPSTQKLTPMKHYLPDIFRNL